MTRKEAQQRSELEEMFLNGDAHTRGAIISALVHVQSRDLLALKRWDRHHRQMAAELLDWADDPRVQPWRHVMTMIDDLRQRYISTAPKQRTQQQDQDGGALDLDVWGPTIDGLQW